jgi:hypothetical protein
MSDQSDPAERSGTLLYVIDGGGGGPYIGVTLSVLLSALGSTLKRWRPLHSRLPDLADRIQVVAVYCNNDWRFSRLFVDPLLVETF